MVELCQKAGLVWGKELHFDATRVRANADVDSLVPRLGEVIDGHVRALFGAAEEQAPYDNTDEQAARGAVAAGSADAPRRWDLLEECRLDPQRPASEGIGAWPTRS